MQTQFGILKHILIKGKRFVVQHYNCLNINDIYDLPVNTICDDDCVLFCGLLTQCYLKLWKLLKDGDSNIKQ